jgi:phosphatidylglycerophosphate synthase
MSDLIDGRVARSRENKSKGGDIFDFVADFLVIFSIFMLWYLEQKVSLYIVFLIIFSFIAFSYIAFVKKRVVKNKN